STRTASTSTTRCRGRASRLSSFPTWRPTRPATRSRWPSTPSTSLASPLTCAAPGCREPEGSYSTGLFADDVAAFMRAAGIGQAHVAGLSLGAATGMQLAAKHPSLVKSLSLHSAWHKSDEFLLAVVESWRIMAEGMGDVTEMVIRGIF